MEVETGIEPVCTALQAVASPLGHSTARDDCPPFERMTGFEPATSPWQGDALPTALHPRATDEIVIRCELKQ